MVTNLKIKVSNNKNSVKKCRFPILQGSSINYKPQLNNESKNKIKERATIREVTQEETAKGGIYNPKFSPQLALSADIANGKSGMIET